MARERARAKDDRVIGISSALMVLGLVLYGEFVLIYSVCLHGPIAQAIVYEIIFNGFFLLGLVSYVRAVKTDPGTTPDTFPNDEIFPMYKGRPMAERAAPLEASESSQRRRRIPKRKESPSSSL